MSSRRAWEKLSVIKWLQRSLGIYFMSIKRWVVEVLRLMQIQCMSCQRRFHRLSRISIHQIFKRICNRTQSMFPQFWHLSNPHLSQVFRILKVKIQKICINPNSQKHPTQSCLHFIQQQKCKQQKILQRAIQFLIYPKSLPISSQHLICLIM